MISDGLRIFLIIMHTAFFAACLTGGVLIGFEPITVVAVVLNGLAVVLNLALLSPEGDLS